MKKVLDYTDSPWNYQGEITHLQKEQVTHALVEYIIAKQHTQISPHLCVFVCVCVCGCGYFIGFSTYVIMSSATKDWQWIAITLRLLVTITA